MPEPVAHQPASIVDAPAGSTDRGTEETGPFDPWPTGESDQTAEQFAASTVGPEVPGYTIIGVLGQGGMGVVYRAIQERLKRVVALKMVLAGGQASVAVLTRFKAEAEAVARLQHPHIVQVFEAGDAAGYPFIALEFVPGGSLAERIRETPLPARAAADLVRTLALAVDHAHRQGVVHRDLKPANVLLDANGLPKVSDFGLARQLDEDSGQTRDGAVLGTPSYMAPEQASGESQQAGPAADVYALGAILYAAVTGRAPFKAATVLETLEQVRSSEPVPPARLQPTVPRDLETICLKCLQKDARKRYATAIELANDLGRFLANEPIVARPVGRVERGLKWGRRHPGVAVLSSVLVGGVLVSLAVTITLWRSAVAAKGRADFNAAHASSEATRADGERDVARSQTRRAAARAYAGDMTRAELAWREMHTATAVRLLRQQLPGAIDPIDENQPNDLRGFEWHYLWRQAHAARTLTGHTDFLHKVAFSPDGKLLASCARDRSIRLWDPVTGQEIRVLLGHVDENKFHASVNDLSFSPDGARLASAGHEGTVRIWDPTNGNLLFTYRGHKEAVRSVAFGPGGRVASVAADRVVRVWDAGTGEEALHFAGTGPVRFSRDGRLLAGVGADKAVKIWDAADGREIFTFPVGKFSTQDLEFGLENRLAWSGWDFGATRGEVRVWDAGTGKELRVFTDLGRIPEAVAISPDGRRVGVATNRRSQPEGEVRVWDVRSGAEELSLRGHASGARALAFAPDGKTLATGGQDQTVRVWDIRDRQESRTFVVKDLLGFFSVSFAPDGHLAAGHIDQKARVWDLRTGQLINILSGPEWKLKSRHVVSFSHDGLTLAVAGYAGTVKLWDMPGGRERYTVPMHRNKITHLEFHPNGRLIVTGAGPIIGAGEWRVLDLVTGQPVGLARPLRQRLSALALSPDGRHLALGTGELKTGEAIVLDFETGETVRVLGGHGGFVSAIAFDPKGRWLATGCHDGVVRLWELGTGALKTILPGHTAEVGAIAFSPDGRRVASASEDMMVKLWDPDIGQETYTLRGHTSAVRDLRFSPDGHLLATAGQDGTIRVWNGTPVQGKLD